MEKKTIKFTVENEKIVYVATDGTEFNNPVACEDYENSAKGVLFARAAKLKVRNTFEFNLFGAGADDYRVEVYYLGSQEDADLLMQLMLLHPGNTDREWIDSTYRRLCTAAEHNDFAFFGRGYVNDDDFAFLGTREEHIDCLNKQCEPEKKEETENK